MRQSTLATTRALFPCVFFVIPSATQAFGLKQAVEMVEWGAVDRTALIVKFWDRAANISQNVAQQVNVDGSSFEVNTSVPYAIEPLFLRGAETYRRERQIRETAQKKNLPHLENYFYVLFFEPLNTEEATLLLRELSADPRVELAHFEPIYSDAVYYSVAGKPDSVLNGPTVPDFEPLQFQLDPAPRGVDARFAWKFPGGDGMGIHVIDLEGTWNENHFEFNPPFFWNGINAHDSDHGTSVWGEIAARPDGQGTTGITPAVEFGLSGVARSSGMLFRQNMVRAIDDAGPNLESGDVIFIEQQAPGPDRGRVAPPEYFPEVFDALKSVTDRGVYCVAAAGNGSSDLDAPAYEGAFDLEVRDSGCLIVGAAAPPTAPNPRSWLGFSNYGSRIDAFGYGDEVVTSGGGDLYSALGVNYRYTRRFSGTSSATPIVTGAVIAISGIAKNQGVAITLSALRDALRNTGTPQQGDLTHRIGTLPDLVQLADWFGFTAP